MGRIQARRTQKSRGKVNYERSESKSEEIELGKELRGDTAHCNVKQEGERLILIAGARLGSFYERFAFSLS